MDYSQIGALLYILLFSLPGLMVGVLAPLVDIRYGNTFLLGAFFDRPLYREDHPVWFWLFEALQITAGIATLGSCWPLVAALFTR